MFQGWSIWSWTWVDEALWQSLQVAVVLVPALLCGWIWRRVYRQPT